MNAADLFASLTGGDSTATLGYAQHLLIEAENSAKGSAILNQLALAPLLGEIDVLSQAKPTTQSAIEDFASKALALNNRILVALGSLDAADAQSQQAEFAAIILAARQGRPERVTAAVNAFTQFILAYECHRSWVEWLKKFLWEILQTDSAFEELQEATSACFEEEARWATHYGRAVEEAMRRFFATIYGEKLDLGSYHIFPSGRCVFRTPAPAEVIELTPARLFDLREDVYLVLMGDF